MDYILGAGLLCAAVLTIALGRLVLNRSTAPADDESFGAVESLAFLFTVILAVGVALMARKAFADASLLSFAQLAGALVLAGVASAAAWIGLRRLVAGEAALTQAPAGPVAPGRGRPQRPSGAGTEGGRKARARRAA